MQGIAKRLQWFLRTPMEPVEQQQVRQWFAYVPVYATAMLILFLIAFVALWGHVPTVYLIAFVIVFIIEGTIKSRLLNSYNRSDVAEQKLPKWRVAICTGTLYSGIVYGLASLVMFVSMPMENLHVIISVYAGILCLIAASTTNHLPSAYLVTIPYLLPVPVALVLSGTTMHLLLACVIALVGVMTLYSFRKTSAALNRLIVLNSENARLLESLSKQKQNAEQHRISAEKAVIDKSKFIAEASHELGQPLHALGLFQGLLRGKSQSPEAIRLLDLIDTSTNSLRQLFNSLLHMSRLDASAVKPELQPVNLDTLFSQLQSEYQPVALEKNIALQINATNRAITTDPTLLLRVLRNLISNAIRYTLSGSITVIAEPVNKDHQADLIITVSDTGVGIPADKLDEIYSEFTQLENSAREDDQGIGLGLSIVKRICDLLEIPINVTSQVGEGTTFTLQLPYGLVTKVNNHNTVTPDYDLSGLQIMVVDDHPETLAAMGSTLESWNCKASIFPNRADALASSMTPDVILCDYRLRSGTTGLVATAQLKEKFGQKIPAIIITADTSAEVLADLLASGLTFLHKPVSPDELRAAINNVLAEAESKPDVVLPD